MADLSLEERYALADFLSSEYSPLKTALQKFLVEQQSTLENESAGYMRTVPRDPERASDAAARADAYENFIRELERFQQKHPPQI